MRDKAFSLLSSFRSLWPLKRQIRFLARIGSINYTEQADYQITLTAKLILKKNIWATNKTNQGYDILNHQKADLHFMKTI